jgi:DNA-binding LytR/AlgR family response regulator
MKLESVAMGEQTNACEHLRRWPMPNAQGALAGHAAPESPLTAIGSSAPVPLVCAAHEPESAAPAYIAAAPRQRLRNLQLIGERAHRFFFLDCQSIDYLQVDGNYVTIHLGEVRYLTRSTLKHLSDVLTPYDFIRIDRGVLVNLQQVEYVERLEGGQFAFQLRRGQYLVANRERSSAIVRLLRSGVR